jgi:hypothetical protein
MATFRKFNAFPEHLAEKVHNLGADALKLALTTNANAPTSSNAILSDLTEIDYSHCSSRAVSIVSSSQSSGAYKLLLSDVTLVASGGSVGPFRNVVLYNDTPSSPSKPLVGWIQLGADVTIASGDAVVVDFDGTNGALSLGEASALPLNVIINGHSQSFGQGTKVAAAINSIYGTTVPVTELGHANAAFDDNGFWGLTSSFASDVLPYFVAGKRNRIYVLCGLVDINDDGKTGATCYTAALNFMSTARAAALSAGYPAAQIEIYLCAICDTTEYDAISPHPTRGDLEPERTDYNSRIVAGVGGTGANGVVRLDLVPHLSNAYDSTYFSDGIHWTTAGQNDAASAIALTAT